MTATAEKTKYTNPLGYPEIRATGLTPLGNLILVQWEEAKDAIEYGKLRLIRPETKRGIHYTGVVLAVGPKVGMYFNKKTGCYENTGEIQVGYRVLFEQFSGFEKYFDPEWGRLALCKEGNILAVIPPRTKVESGEDDFDFSK